MICNKFTPASRTRPAQPGAWTFSMRTYVDPTLCECSVWGGGMNNFNTSLPAAGLGHIKTVKLNKAYLTHALL